MQVSRDADDGQNSQADFFPRGQDKSNNVHLTHSTQEDPASFSPYVYDKVLYAQWVLSDNIIVHVYVQVFFSSHHSVLTICSTHTYDMTICDDFLLSPGPQYMMMLTWRRSKEKQDFFSYSFHQMKRKRYLLKK